MKIHQVTLPKSWRPLVTTPLRVGSQTRMPVVGRTHVHDPARPVEVEPHDSLG